MTSSVASTASSTSVLIDVDSGPATEMGGGAAKMRGGGGVEGSEERGILGSCSGRVRSGRVF